MGRNNNAYAKRQRDMRKKQKAEDKRARRLKRKEDTQDIEKSGEKEPVPSES